MPTDQISTALARQSVWTIVWMKRHSNEEHIPVYSKINTAVSNISSAVSLGAYPMAARADLAECFGGGQMTFWEGQTVERSRFFQCNVIDIMLKFLVVWSGAKSWFQSLWDGSWPCWPPWIRLCTYVCGLPAADDRQEFRWPFWYFLLFSNTN